MAPLQTAGHLAKLHPQEAAKRISHETIYNVIYAQPRGELRRELIACLRLARTKRWPRSRGEDRQFPGHWEGDLLKGAGNQSAVGTLVERNTRLLMLVKLSHPNPATAAHVLQAFTEKLNAIAPPMRKMLPYDRGREMALSASRCAKALLDAGHHLRALRVTATGVMQSGLRWRRSHSRRRFPFAFAPYAPPSARVPAPGNWSGAVRCAVG